MSVIFGNDDVASPVVEVSCLYVIVVVPAVIPVAVVEGAVVVKVCNSHNA